MNLIERNSVLIRQGSAFLITCYTIFVIYGIAYISPDKEHTICKNSKLWNYLVISFPFNYCTLIGNSKFIAFLKTIMVGYGIYIFNFYICNVVQQYLLQTLFNLAVIQLSFDIVYVLLFVIYNVYNNFYKSHYAAAVPVHIPGYLYEFSEDVG